jgi:hypothetical protein
MSLTNTGIVCVCVCVRVRVCVCVRARVFLFLHWHAPLIFPLSMATVTFLPHMLPASVMHLEFHFSQMILKLPTSASKQALHLLRTFLYIWQCSFLDSLAISLWTLSLSFHKECDFSSKLYLPILPTNNHFMAANLDTDKATVCLHTINIKFEKKPSSHTILTYIFFYYILK